jgi:hypothetical protein
MLRLTFIDQVELPEQGSQVFALPSMHRRTPT